jgi:hypothetical protein
MLPGAAQAAKIESSTGILRQPCYTRRPPQDISRKGPVRIGSFSVFNYRPPGARMWLLVPGEAHAVSGREKGAQLFSGLLIRTGGELCPSDFSFGNAPAPN